MSTYKLYVSGYLEESQQLLVSFSSDETNLEAADYPALAFDIIAYGDSTPTEIIRMIAFNARNIIEDQKVIENYKDNSEKAEGLKALVGQTFNYTYEELFPSIVTSEVEEI